MNTSSAARACGIDFGTSNSTVGWLRPGADTLIPLEDGKITLPSVVFFNYEEDHSVFGRKALLEYTEGYEGRLMRSLKSLLGSSLIDSQTEVQGRALPFRHLLTLFIQEVKQRADRAAGRPFEQVVLGRPVFFVDDNPRPTHWPKKPWPRLPARSASRTFPSSLNRWQPPSTTNPPSPAKNWC
jgi:hypothetical chaperone protein